MKPIMPMQSRCPQIPEGKHWKKYLCFLPADSRHTSLAQTPTFEVLHGHETAKDGSGSQRVTAASLDGYSIRGAVPKQVHQGRVEVEDGCANVYVVLVILRGQGTEVILAARGRQITVSTYIMDSMILCIHD